MKQANPRERPIRTEKIPSNNENDNKHTTMIEEENEQLLGLKAGARKR